MKLFTRTALLALAGAWVIAGLFMLFAPACSGSQAKIAVNASRLVGEEAAVVLHEQCELKYQTAETAERVKELRSYCDPAMEAYDIYRAAWFALMTIVKESEFRPAGDAEVARIAKSLALASEGLESAIAAIPRAN